MKSKRIHYAWWIMASCMALMFGCTGILVGTQGIFFNSVINGLGIKASKFSLSLTIGYLARAFSLPKAAILLNKYNNNILLSLAVILHVCAFIAMGLYKTIYGFYISAALMGLASSITSIMAVPILINSWFATRVGTVMGITMSFSGVGAAVMQYIGAVIINQYGWRTAYFVLGLFALVLTLPFTLFIIRSEPSEKELLPYGIDPNNNEKSKINKNSKIEDINFRGIYKNSLFYIMVVFAVFVGYIVSFQTHISNFAASIGVEVVQTGLIAAVSSIALMIGKFTIGFFNDRCGIYYTTLIYSLFGVIASIIEIIFVDSYLVKPLAVGIGISICLGFLFAIPTTSTPIIIRTIFGSKVYGVIYSKIVMFYTIAMAFGSTINGLLFDVFDGYSFILNIIAILSILSTLLVYMASYKSSEK